MIGQRSLIVDLTHLTGLDAAGRNLLAEWHALGATDCNILGSAGANSVDDRRSNRTRWSAAGNFPMASLADGGTVAGSLVVLLFSIATASPHAGPTCRQLPQYRRTALWTPNRIQSGFSKTWRVARTLANQMLLCLALASKML